MHFRLVSVHSSIDTLFCLLTDGLIIFAFVIMRLKVSIDYSASILARLL